MGGGGGGVVGRCRNGLGNVQKAYNCGQNGGKCVGQVWCWSRSQTSHRAPIILVTNMSSITESNQEVPGGAMAYR